MTRCVPIDTSTVAAKDLDMKKEPTPELRLAAPSTRPTNDMEDGVSTKVAKKPRVKKKKKLDEIDEIFGF